MAREREMMPMPMSPPRYSSAHSYNRSADLDSRGSGGYSSGPSYSEEQQRYPPTSPPARERDRDPVMYGGGGRRESELRERELREREMREREMLREREIAREREREREREEQQKRNSVVIKVGMVGDAQIGKTSLMVKYVEGSFDEDYIQTLGESFPKAEACSDTPIPTPAPRRWSQTRGSGENEGSEAGSSGQV